MDELPGGPGEPFQVLLDEDMGDGLPLAAPFRAIYGGDWRMPEPSTDRPHTYVNFVSSRDGRVSVDEPGHMGGADISRFNRHDQWLMALLRARADAILVGDNTVRLEPDHIWTADHIFPDDASAWRDLRRSEGRAAVPLHVFLSMRGDLPAEAAVFARADIPVLVATTDDGARNARSLLRGAPNVEVLAFGRGAVPLHDLSRRLRVEFGIQSMLCEGGAHVYGAMIAARQMDDEFLTLSPIIVGNRPRGDGQARPSLVEGVAFSPNDPPFLQLLSVRRFGDYMFLRSRMSQE